jgi:hypothetical protein
MPGKRIRIDVTDKDGVKFDLKLEGNVTREKVLKIFELMELANIEEPSTTTPDINTVGGKIWAIVDKYFPTGKFTSNDILEKYEDEYNEPIKLSIISTYLARFTSKNKTERARKGREWAYQALRIPQKAEN